MALELEAQIRDYASYVREAGAVQVDELLDSVRYELPPPTPPSRWRPLTVALAAAAIALVLVGGLALLLRLTQEPPVIDEEEVSTTTTVPEPPESLGDGRVVLDAAGDVGIQPDVLIGDDGLPLVVYTDRTRGTAKVARCTDVSCTDVVLTELGAVGEAVSHGPTITEGSDGLPLITFGTEDELVLYKCSSEDCSQGTVTRLAGGPTSIQPPLVIHAADGLPFVVFSTRDADLVALACGDVACSTENVVTTIRPGGSTIDAAWLAFATNGRPLIGYHRYLGPGVEFGVIECLDRACTAHHEIDASSVPDIVPGSSVGEMVTGPTGQSLLIRYEDLDGEGNTALVAVACGDAVCTSGATTIIEQYFGDISFDPEVVFGASWSPMIFYVSGAELKLAHCFDRSCAGEVTTETLIDVGGLNSQLGVAPGADGNPFIAFYSNSDLNVVACPDPTCSELASPTPQPAPPGEAWAVTKLSKGEVATADFNPPAVLGPDGLLTIAYVEQVGPREDPEQPPDIKVVRCLDPSCSQTTVTSLGIAGWALSLAAGPGDGLTLIYQDFETIWVTQCADTVCASHETTVLAETGTWANPGAVPMSDSIVVLTYQDWNDYYPRLVQCGEGGCSTEGADAPIGVFEDDEVFRWLMNTLSYGPSAAGRPYLLAVEGRDEGNAELRLVRCLDEGCLSGEPLLLDDSLLGDATAAMVVPEDGLPLIAYYADGSLVVVKCADADCSQRSSTVVGPAIAEFIASVAPSIAFGPTGDPVIAYWDLQRHVILASCADAACTESTLTDFGDVGSHSLLIGPNGLPILVYHANSELWVAKCTDLACLEP